MGVLELRVGQGESKTLRFKLTTSEFVDSDKLLFAVKNDVSSCEYEYSLQANVGELAYEDVGEGKKKYTFTVVLASDLTRGLARRTYYYDLTLIDEYGEEMPLITPQPLVVSGTVGASTKKGG